jgi:cell division inhibitor SepF
MGSWRKVGAFLGLVPEDSRGYDGDEYDNRDYPEDYDGQPYRPSASRYRGSGERDYTESSPTDGYPGRGDGDLQHSDAQYADAAKYAERGAPRYSEGSEHEQHPAVSAQPRYTRPRRGFAEEPVTQGSLAMQPRVEAPPQPEPTSANRPVTVKLTGFADARVVGEKFREGLSVILDMTEMDDSDARRLVDFAAGLAFASRGSIDKVTTKVFMLLPAVDLSTDLDETRDAALADARMAVAAR